MHRITSNILIDSHEYFYVVRRPTNNFSSLSWSFFIRERQSEFLTNLVGWRYNLWVMGILHFKHLRWITILMHNHFFIRNIVVLLIGNTFTQHWKHFEIFLKFRERLCAPRLCNWHGILCIYLSIYIDPRWTIKRARPSPVTKYYISCPRGRQHQMCRHNLPLGKTHLNFRGVS